METATNLMEIPDHLLAEILLRLPASEDLARASAACVTFRRLVHDTDGSFLRRFRRLHDPPLLAFFDRDGLHHALPPHSSAPAARALAAAADFSFSFFPNHRQWGVSDIRDGRVLLLRRADGKHPQELAVCDPLHRKYVLLPPVPDELAASVALAHKDDLHKLWCDAFLTPIDDEVEAAFGVIWMAHSAARLAALLFCSRTGQWQTAASKACSDLFFERGESTVVPPIAFRKRQYAYGCFYWEYTMQKPELIVLDTRDMEFSVSDLPPREFFGLAIVEAGEGRLGLFGILAETFFGEYHLCYYIKCKTSGQWQLQKTVPLGSGFRHDVKTATGRYLLLGKYGVLPFVDSAPHQPDLEYISVDVKTLQLERVCRTSSGSSHVKKWIYTNFPTSLSSPTI